MANTPQSIRRSESPSLFVRQSVSPPARIRSMAPPPSRQGTTTRKHRRQPAAPEIKEEEPSFDDRQRRWPRRETVDLDMDGSGSDDVVHVDREDVATEGMVNLRHTGLYARRTKVFGQVKQQYIAVFTRQIPALANREKKHSNHQYEVKLAGVHTMIGSVRKLNAIVELHDRHGKETLRAAKAFLRKEFESAEGCVEKLWEEKAKESFRKVVLRPMEERLQDMEQDCDFVEALMKDVRELTADLDRRRSESVRARSEVLA